MPAIFLLSVGIALNDDRLISGGITNSGTISGAEIGIYASNVAIFSGGISNVAGGKLVGSEGLGIRLLDVSSFAGGISNAGTISGGATGVNYTIRQGSGGGGFQGFGGGISNAGTISGASFDGVSIEFKATDAGHLAISTFAGGISNTGLIAAHQTGIFFGGFVTDGSTVVLSTFSGNIVNSGTISAEGYRRHCGRIRRQ